MDAEDASVLLEEKVSETPTKLSDKEVEDDFESLKSDMERDSLIDRGLKLRTSKKASSARKTDDILGDIDPEIIIDESIDVLNDTSSIVKTETNKDVPKIFDVGTDEKKLLEIAKFVEGRIPDDEWDEISTSAQLDRYIIQEGDWLWKISQRMFGSGFYYSKIWSLNPQITNPHEIEPGMVLLFDTGSEDRMPEVKLGEYKDNPFEASRIVKKNIDGENFFDFNEFGEGVEPPWIKEREKLISDGIYFQYVSEETYEDLAKRSGKNLVTEYRRYEPVLPEVLVEEPRVEDVGGFDKNSKVQYDFKQGFYLNTFITSNIVQDLGQVLAIQDERIFIRNLDTIYVKFDSSVRPKPGDLFSIYKPEGKVATKYSDRSGYRYKILAQIKVMKKINDLWVCEIREMTGLVERKDRITVYTPKIEKIVKTFNKRRIEAAIIEAEKNGANGLSYGDVIYLDRGRADGVELGSVFETYSFVDKGTGKRITLDPTYKTGELTVISLTDSFSTALVTNSSDVLTRGTLAFTKTEEDVMRASRVKGGKILSDIAKIEKRSLDELDIELNLDDLSEDLLREADKVQLTEDELEELNRQEREKSIIKDHERDLRELDRLENEIVGAEKALNEAKVDEDKFLEQQDLNKVERLKKKDPDAYEQLNEVEKEVGIKYMDEDLNSKENPYGLTEFDLEEIDELLNSEQL